MKKILEYLEQLDFSAIEAKIYLTLLKTGPLTVQELAKKTGINRTATYSHLNTLLEKGVLIEVMRQSRKKLTAVEPEQLNYLIERKFDKVKALKSQFPEIINSINTSFIQTNDEHNVDVKYYKGKTGIKAMFDEALNAKELRSYANLAQLADVLSADDLTMFDKAIAENKRIKIWELIADTPDVIKHFGLEETAKSKRYIFKFIPESVGLASACIMLYDDRVAIFNVRKDVSGIVLHNKDYYLNSKKLFDFMWSMLP